MGTVSFYATAPGTLVYSKYYLFAIYAVNLVLIVRCCKKIW